MNGPEAPVKSPDWFPFFPGSPMMLFVIQCNFFLLLGKVMAFSQGRIVEFIKFAAVYQISRTKSHWNKRKMPTEKSQPESCKFNCYDFQTYSFTLFASSEIVRSGLNNLKHLRESPWCVFNVVDFIFLVFDSVYYLFVSKTKQERTICCDLTCCVEDRWVGSSYKKPSVLY